MRQLIHKSPLGPLSIPGVLGEPAPGEPFEVDDDIAESLLEQSDLFAPAESTELTIAQLRNIAEQRGIDLTGLRTKPDIAAAIARHDEAQTVGDTDSTEGDVPRRPSTHRKAAKSSDDPGRLQHRSQERDDLRHGRHRRPVPRVHLGVDRLRPHVLPGQGMRPGSRLARSGRRALTKDGGKGDVELEVPSRGLGTFLEAIMGVGVSNLVSTGLYQQLFTLIKDDFLPSVTMQKGIPRLGANVVDAYTARGAVCSSFELSMANADVLKLSSSWTAREIDTSIAYATPSYPAASELFTFVGAALTIGGASRSPRRPPSPAGGTPVANIRDFSISVDQKLDGNGYNMGGAGKRSRRPAVGIAEVKGRVTAEYDAITMRDALASQAPLALVATFQAATDITAGNKPTLQVVVPRYPIRERAAEVERGRRHRAGDRLHRVRRSRRRAAALHRRANGRRRAVNGRLGFVHRRAGQPPRDPGADQGSRPEAREQPAAGVSPQW